MTKYRLPHEENECACASDSHNHSAVRLSCGNGTGLTLPVGGDSGCGCGSGNRFQSPALIVGTVNLDTTGLPNPTIKIDFSSLISFGAASGEGEYFLGIIFKLSKISNNGAQIPLETWIFEKKADAGIDCCEPNGVAPNPGRVEVRVQEPFSFHWCECHACPGCFTYVLEVIHFEGTFIDFALIGNVSISAMAV
ncbi:MAG: DUF4489 domain-containing protein [Syntrophomonadaceae bacterium]|nr:DUF4489 domain-containing protein [Syntrophomonadaceae bacterium]